MVRRVETHIYTHCEQYWCGAVAYNGSLSLYADSIEPATTTTTGKSIRDIYECKQEVNMSVLLLFLWYFYEGFLCSTMDIAIRALLFVTVTK